MKKKERQRIKKASKLLVSALVAGALFSAPVMADSITVSDWSEFQTAVNNYDVTTINVNADITYGGTTNTIARELSIVGNSTDRYLSGNGAYAGLAIVAGGNLTLTDINMQNFKIEGSNESGGAIYNYAAFGNSSVESITGNFTSNSISGYAGTGGAIYNYAESNHIGSIGNITGDFTSNSASLDSTGGAGGAIYNYAYGSNANIGNIIGNFTSNSVGSDGAGGAIYNFATLSAIGSIGNITGDFTSNSAGHSGGAICNYARGLGQATLSILATNNKDVTFNGNYMTSASGKGGAIYNHSEGATAIIGLYADANRTITFVGGADETGKYDIDGIYNDSTLNINGNSTDRYTGTVNLYKVSDADPTDPTEFQGITNIYDGTVNVKDTLTQKTLNLIGGTLNLGRNAEVYDFNVTDGAKLSLSIPDGTFENYENVINTLDVSNNFSGVLSNLTVDYDADAVAGSNMDKITVGTGYSAGSVKLTSVNVIKDGTTMADGTFIDGVLNNITDNTDSVTSTTTSGGWKYTFTPYSKGKVSVTRTATAETLAQVIQNATGSSSFSINTNPYTTNEDLGSLAGTGRNFTIYGNGNTIDGTNLAGGKFDGITIGNSSGQEFTLENATMQNFTTAITNKAGATANVNGVTFANNDTDIANNGTLNLSGTNSISTITGTGTTSIIGGTVNANATIEQDIINVKSGATLASNTAGVEIKADGTNGNLINDGTINITGANSRFGADHLTNNATINITGANSLLETSTLTNNGTIDTVSLLSNSLNNNGNITTSGGIEAIIQNNEGGSITFNGDNEKLMRLTNSGTVNFNGRLDTGNSKIQLTQNDGVMNFSTNAIESTTNLPINIFSMNGGSVNIADGSVNTLHIRQLNLTGNTNFAMDADLAAENMDKIQIHDVANSIITEGKVININKINLLSDATQEKINLSIFADDATKNALKNNVHSNINGLQYSPIYKYDALYNPETGMVGFTRYKNGGYDDLNPSIMAGAVAAQVGGYLNQLNSYDNAFEHMDMYMLLTKDQRTAMKMLNRYASADANLGTYNPNQLADETRGVWFKPYATFEKVNLKSGPNVENTAYGSFVGGDSDLIELKNGWDVMYSAYASYDGSHQNYDGVSIYQNGGHLGGTATWYKGNFFTGLTANVGASVAEASTMYGTDNMTMLMAGVASKTGYNWELLNSRLIVQPSMLLSYSFVNMFDYTNKAGVAIDSDPLHAIQIAPGLKFIGNLPHGWQPYIGVQMVWNIMDETKFSAANVNLPQLSTRPYFQYGIGVQKKWGDRFSGYLQAMLRNGGRTGIALSAGFRWALGKDVKNPNFNKTSNSVPELPKTKMNLSSASK